MRRFLMLIALLALVLNGPGAGVAARTSGPMAAACATASCSGGCGSPDRAEARSLDPLQGMSCGLGARRCHPGRPAPVPVAVAPRLAALEPVSDGHPGPGPEPAPWPCMVAQPAVWHGPTVARGPGGVPLTVLPEGFPGVLARTCVLRI